MQYKTASINLLGDRDNNQDRVDFIEQDGVALGFVADGMGGHVGGEKAAIEAIEVCRQRFDEASLPLHDPAMFLRRTIAASHHAIVNLGKHINVDHRPRATCAAFVLQQGAAVWAHVGDARVYHFRQGQILDRTRDHTHIEQLLQEGLIAEEDMAEHPLRSFVDNCLGGAPETPDITLSTPRPLASGDIIMACSDGIWNGLDDRVIAGFFDTEKDSNLDLEQGLAALGEAALLATHPGADNTTATVIQWLDDPST